MIIIYILLGVIAVGILLISKDGKRILEWAGVSLVIGVTLTIIALVFFVVISFLKAHSFGDVLLYFIVSLIPLGIVIIAWKIMRFIIPHAK